MIDYKALARELCGVPDHSEPDWDPCPFCTETTQALRDTHAAGKKEGQESIQAECDEWKRRTEKAEMVVESDRLWREALKSNADTTDRAIARVEKAEAALRATRRQGAEEMRERVATICHGYGYDWLADDIRALRIEDK